LSCADPVRSSAWAATWKKGSALRPDPLWAKAPFALRRYPGLFASLALGALLLSLAAVALPLFLSATTTDLLRRQVEGAGVSRYGAGLEYRNDPLAFDALAADGEEPLSDRLGDLFARETARSPVLGGTVEGIMGSVISVMPQAGSAEVREGRLFAGTGAGAQVEMLAGTADEGVTLPDLIADALGVGPGDRVTLTGRGDRSATVVVGGIYRALYARPTPGYWQAWDDEIHNIRCTDCAPLPQFILVARDPMVALERRLGWTEASFTWQAPLATSAITLQQALALRRFVATFHAAISDPGSELGATFHCCLEPALFVRRNEIAFRTYIPKVIDAVEARVAAIEAPGRILRTAGLMVASLVVAATGMFAFGARRPEARLLHARGVSPMVVGARGAAEAVLPCVLGGSMGVGLGALLVLTLGADGAVAGDVWPGAFRSAAVAVLVAVALLGLIATIAYLGSSERASSGRSLRWIPWELPVLAVGWLELERIRSIGALTAGSGGVDRPSSLVMAVPILLLAGALGVSVRLFRWVAAWLRGRSGRYGPASFLAVHRLAAAPALTAALFVASGLCLGVFVEGQTLVRSLQTTVEAKAKIFVGSDVQGRIDRGTEPIGPLPVPVTRVTRLPQAGTMDTGQGEFDLLAIDPVTFASAAFWNDSFADEPLSTLVGRLDDAPTTGLPVVVVGDAADPVSLTMQQQQIPVTVVGRATAFPGAASLRPLVVVDAAAIEGWPSLGPAPLAQARASTELWGRGDPGEVIDAFSTLDLPPFQVVTAAETMDIPSIAAVVNTFLALNALGLGAAILVVGALLMYLQARERSRLVAHGLSLRMGMTDGIHRRSMLIETTSLLTSSYAVGLVVALVVAVATVPLLDPLTAVRPAPLVVLPARPMLLTLAGLALASWLACLVADVRTRRVPLGEVMRTAE
jgi:putative ABC transport system permease protein